MYFKVILLYYYIKYKFFVKINNRKKLEAFQAKKIRKHLKYVTEKYKLQFILRVADARKQFPRALKPETTSAPSDMMDIGHRFVISHLTRRSNFNCGLLGDALIAQLTRGLLAKHAVEQRDKHCVDNHDDADGQNTRREQRGERNADQAGERVTFE